MSKFKVGDKVKWKEDEKDYAAYTEGRDPEEILTVSGFNQNIVKFEEFELGAFDYRFELVEESPQTSKYKTGDVVVLTEGATLNHMTPRVKIVSPLGSECYQVCQIFKEDDVWKICETEINHEATTKLQISNEKPSFVSFFTSVIVAKNKAVGDIGELLYDENTTKIYLEDEGGGAFLIVEQDYNGAIQQIRLDIDEVDTVFSAIKQLVNQMEGK